MEVYDALKAAGAPDDKAADAARAVADIREEEWLRRIEERLIALEGGQRLLQWMLAFNLALTAAVLFKLLM